MACQDTGTYRAKAQLLALRGCRANCCCEDSNAVQCYAHTACVTIGAIALLAEAEQLNMFCGSGHAVNGHKKASAYCHY